MDVRTLRDLVSRRIRYVKPGGRFGWEGTLTYVGGAGRVEYDNGVQQDYSLEAFLPPNTKYKPSIKRGPYSIYEGGYLQILDADATKVEGGYFTLSDGTLTSWYKTYDEAITAATAMASGPNSESVTILRALAVVELAAPPVRVRNL